MSSLLHFNSTLYRKIRSEGVGLSDFPQILKSFCFPSISLSFHVGRHKEQWFFFLLHSKIDVNVGSFFLLNPLLFRLGRKLKPDTEPNPITHPYLNLWVPSPTYDPKTDSHKCSSNPHYLNFQTARTVILRNKLLQLHAY